MSEISKRTPQPIVLFSLLLSLVFFSGCDPTLDATSLETIKSSGFEVKKNMSPEEKEAFNKAMQVIGLHIMKEMSVKMASIKDAALMAANTEDRMRDALHGKTGDEIIELAESFESEAKKSACDAITNDLANMAISEEAYHIDNNVYTSNFRRLQGQGYRTTPKVTVEFVSANDKYFEAIGSHPDCSDKYYWHSGKGGLQGS